MTSENTCIATKANGDPCTYHAKYDDGKCGIHTDEASSGSPGRPSKFTSARRTQIIERAKSGATIEGCARAAGISYDTLHNWLNRGEDSADDTDDFAQFFQAFTRARASGEQRLVERVAKQDPRFLLQTSYDYVKTERREQEITGKGGGPLRIRIGGDSNGDD